VDSREWLKQLGMEHHAESFAENEVGPDLLPDLTNDDLKDLGVVKLGERKAILQAIANLARAEEVADEPAAEPPRPLAAQEGERRQVTVLFADISGFTKLSAGLDAEETHRLLNRYFEVVDSIVLDFGGIVDKHIGDSVMAVFGAPIAHTNDPERAIRAAAAIHAAMPKLAEELGLSLQAHIGIASGQVVASGTGSDAHRTYTVTGDTVNLASRLDDMAGPGETLVSKNVHDATTAIAAFAAKGEAAVKGFDQAVEVWAVRGLRDARPSERLGPFVGRRSELRQFEALLDECREEGQGQAVLVRGEPGIGKTRLIEEFSNRAAAMGYAAHHGLVLDFGVGKGQDAIRSLVRSLLGIPPGSGKTVRARAAQEALAHGQVSEDNLIFLNDLLDLEQPLALQSLYDAMESNARNEGKRQTVAALLNAQAKQMPCLLVVEDIHWADRLTLNHLTILSSSIDESPVILVMTTRLEGRTMEQEWLASMRGCPLTTMELFPLRAAQALSFAKALAAEKDANLEEIIARSEGNPLFIEQLVRSIGLGHHEQLPDTIQGLVLARTDQLPAKDREALQAASVIGQRFDLEALRAILEDDDYQPETLLRHRLVRPVGDALLFGHALIQEGVYASLLKSRRTALHSRAARWFAERDLSLYAAHLDRAEDPGCARAYGAAAEAETKIYHYEKAEALLRRGIEVAAAGAEGISLICALGELLHDTGRIQDSMDRFGEALEQAADDAERCHAWFGLAMGLRVQNDHSGALALLEKAQPVAEAHGVDDLLGRIHELRGNLCFMAGDLARCSAEHGAALDWARRTNSVDLEAKALGGLADAYYASGKMITAFEYGERCVALSQQHGLGRTAVAYQAMLGLVKLYQLDIHESERLSGEAIATAERLGHQRAEVMGRLIHAYALSERGDHDGCLKTLEPCPAIIDRLGLEFFRPEPAMYSSGALLHRGKRKEAVQALVASAELCRQTSANYTLGIALGRLALATEDSAQRESALREGLAVLDAGALSHNHLDFYRSAIETMLQIGAWDRIEDFAARLEAYTAAEPLPWSRYVAGRGRALAAWGAGERGEATIAELRALHAEGRKAGLLAALPRIETALADLQLGAGG
jgi:class 3 adenylate cyclase/tetratricopeptide (TPR) repeat protein